MVDKEFIVRSILEYLLFTMGQCWAYHVQSLGLVSVNFGRRNTRKEGKKGKGITVAYHRVV